ncbi:retinol dehydrogenase 8-like isoform X2 [Ahaetulla prasina]|uniref:retinol dehydrogenase 8-like isoform X2 n=1 Tax=Ahaetulla prasina TaxID=499056 RepID=UPI00264A3D2E|nr:retinol dehydrogenase 8-like isoform X2 [Ahaetulla prasina]
MSPKIVLITGCSSGIGLALAAKLAKDKQKRFKVIATMRNITKKEKLEAAIGPALNQTLEIKQLDVCDEKSIHNCINSIPQRHIDILSIIFNDIYAASKFAIEGFCESLIIQALRFNIFVSLIEPGPVVTEFEMKIYEDAEKADYSQTDSETAEIFSQIYLKNSKAIFSSLSQTPEDVAEHVLKVICMARPPFRYQTNAMYTPMVALKQADPTGALMTDSFYKLVFRYGNLLRISLRAIQLLRWQARKVKQGVRLLGFR